MQLLIKKLDPRAKIPQRATSGSAGYDLYALLEHSVRVEPGKRACIPTGIAIALPSADYAALVYARSGLATKHGIIPANCVGVIDSDYRGEVLVNLANIGDEAYEIAPFERVAQLIVTPVVLPELVETDVLDETERGEGGFGSTGKG